MAKEEQIQIKSTRPVKEALKIAAAKRGRGTGPWLLYLAALADSQVAEAMGIDVSTIKEDTKDI